MTIVHCIAEMALAVGMTLAFVFHMADEPRLFGAVFTRFLVAIVQWYSFGVPILSSQESAI